MPILLLALGLMVCAVNARAAEYVVLYGKELSEQMVDSDPCGNKEGVCLSTLFRQRLQVIEVLKGALEKRDVYALSIRGEEPVIGRSRAISKKTRLFILSVVENASVRERYGAGYYIEERTGPTRYCLAWRPDKYGYSVPRDDDSKLRWLDRANCFKKEFFQR